MQASIHLAKGNTDKALQHYAGKNAVKLCEDPIEQLISDWKNDTNSILLSFTRKSVTTLNQKARDVLKEQGHLGKEDFFWQAQEKALPIVIGERLLFCQNDKALGVRNGDVGTVKQLSSKELQIQLDSGEHLIIPNTYQSIDYGYALTVHKSQGMTANKVKVLVDSKSWDKHLAFVAMTRHKENLEMYVDQSIHSTMDALIHTLSKTKTHHNVIDWSIDFATRIGLNPDKLLGQMINCVAKAIQPTTPKHPLLTEYEMLLKQQQHLTGYYREKIDKRIQQVTNKIQQNAKLMQQLAPHVMQKIQQLNYKMKKGIEHDL